MKQARLTLALLALCLMTAVTVAEEVVFQDGKWAPTASPEADYAAGLLAKARQMLMADRPGKALKAAKKLLRKHPDSPLVEEALNLAGQAQMDRGRYYKAFTYYEKQVGQFPTGPLFERAMAREATIAEAFLTGTKRRMWGFIPVGMTEEGLDILQDVADRSPGTELAEKALMRAADYLYDAERWEEAADAYQNYVDLFRGRYRSSHAEYRAAQATYNRFAGLQWDLTPLLEAQQRFKTALANYPKAPQADYAANVLNEIDELLAKKDYGVARFYNRIGRDQAAAFYDREVVELYPKTPWAEKSAKALEQSGFQEVAQ